MQNAPLTWRTHECVRHSFRRTSDANSDLAHSTCEAEPAASARYTG